MMTVDNFAFTPVDGLRNAGQFPTTPASEADARDQVQDISDQIRDYINNTIIAELNNKLSLAGGSLTGALASAGTLTGTGIIATGLTGATAASRYVGATASGAPASGTFAKGDFVVDQAGMIWICTTAGAPGTWVKPTGSPVVTGTYTGDNTANRLINTGSPPKLVWLVWADGNNNRFAVGLPENTVGKSEGLSGANAGTVTSNGDGTSNASYVPLIRAGSNGFFVNNGPNTGTDTNYTGITYKYFALV